MRIAFFSDIHGNLPALQQALAKIHELQCDQLIIGGDVVGIGPFPAECVDLLRAEPNAGFIMGNHEKEILKLKSQAANPNTPQNEQRHFKWVAAQLSETQKSWIATWPLSLELSTGGQQIRCLHYPYDAHRDDFIQFEPSSVKNLDRLFKNETNPIILFGHDHKSCDFNGQHRYLNPGSLGCFSEPKAQFLVLESNLGTLTCEYYAVPYDDTLLSQEFEARQVPDRAGIYKAFFGNRYRPGPAKS